MQDTGSGAERTAAQESVTGGAQDAAETMPYHRHRRTECNHRSSSDPGVAVERIARPPCGAPASVDRRSDPVERGRGRYR